MTDKDFFKREKRIIKEMGQEEFQEFIKKCGDVEVDRIILVIGELIQEKINAQEAVYQLFGDVGNELSLYLQDLLYEFCKKDIDEILKEVNVAKIKELSESEFSSILTDCCKQAGEYFKQYIRKEINVIDLLQSIAKIDFSKVKKMFLSALDINSDSINDYLNKVSQLDGMAICYGGLCVFYHELSKALDQENIEHQKMLEIHQMCDKIILEAVKTRKEIETLTKNYFEKFYFVINDSFETMDKAYLSKDVNTYIDSQIKLQKLLEYDYQYSNKDEFEKIMVSSKPIKL